MLFQTHKAFVHLRRSFWWNLRAFCPYFTDIYATTYLMLQNVHKETVKWIHMKWAVFVQIFWRDSIALYDEQIEFRLLFTYKHLSTHTLFVVNRSSNMLAWRAKTNAVHSCVRQHVWASVRGLFRFGWASVYVHWSMFICE